MKLSILIPTIFERRKMLGNLLEHLYKQQQQGVEILYLGDNRTMTLAQKQNKLLSVASGDYIGFIDDDDWTSDDYIRCILKGTEPTPDVISLDMLYSQNGAPKVPVHVSIHNDRFINNPPHYYKRFPSDKSFVKREHALKTGFDENIKNGLGIDTDYATRIRPLLKTEYHINKPIYHYNFNCRTSTTG